MEDTSELTVVGPTGRTTGPVDVVAVAYKASTHTMECGCVHLLDSSCWCSPVPDPHGWMHNDPHPIESVLISTDCDICRGHLG